MGIESLFAAAGGASTAEAAIGQVAQSASGGGGMSQLGSTLGAAAGPVGSIVGAMVGGTMDFAGSMARGGYRKFTGSEALTGVEATPSYMPYNFRGGFAGAGNAGGGGSSGGRAVLGPQGGGGTSTIHGTPSEWARYAPGRGYSGGGSGPIQATYEKPFPKAIEATSRLA